jgi:uncharacterized protein
MSSRMMERLIAEPFQRPLPEVSARETHFWSSGGEGRLSIARCAVCSTLAHPTPIICSVCHSKLIRPEYVSGHGILFSFTVNHYQWETSVPPPYVVAIVELEEQAGLQLTTNLVECDFADVQIGMAVEACFARLGRWYIPLFRPRVIDGSVAADRARTQ